jgi:hypothetical protein
MEKHHCIDLELEWQFYEGFEHVSNIRALAKVEALHLVVHLPNQKSLDSSPKKRNNIWFLDRLVFAEE